MKGLIVPILAVLSLGACATNPMSDSDRLALFQAHAGAPVRHVRYVDPIGWDRIDDWHVVLQMRPNESWLLTLNGPCLGWGGGSPYLKVLTLDGMSLTPFDRVYVPGSQASCMIREIRPVNLRAVRAAQDAMLAQASAGT